MHNKIIADHLSKQNIVIFSGGSGARGLAKELKNYTQNVSYIIPTSDNGGSTSEIMRRLGGPAIGDIRSRLCDLSPNNTPEEAAVTTLLSSRIHTLEEWNTILLGTHDLYRPISAARKELIRSDLLFCDQQMKSKAPDFDFANASIGNLFLTGTRLRTNSLDAAILQFRDMARISEQVIPIINSNHTLTIAATLENGEILYGQNNISHPSETTHVNKSETEPLPAKISDLHYIDFEKKPYTPTVNPEALEVLRNADQIIYSMGSFWTSIMPSLIVDGVAEAIAKSSAKKIFILNGSQDRETQGMTATDMVQKIVTGLNSDKNQYPFFAFINALAYLNSSDITVDQAVLEKSGMSLFPFTALPNKNYYKNSDIVNLLLKKIVTKFAFEKYDQPKDRQARIKQVLQEHQ